MGIFTKKAAPIAAGSKAQGKRFIERAGKGLREARIIAGANMIEALLHIDDAKAAKAAADALRAGASAAKQGLGDIPGFTLGGGAGDRRIGGVPQQDSGEHETGLGFDDPLAGKGSQRHRSTGLVTAGGVPGKRDLVSGDGTDGGTSYTSGAQSSHGYVWAERNTERTSTDGMRTWGSTMYRDYSGNHSRIDYTETRTEDGGVHGKETLFDGENNPVSTTVRDGAPDGSAKSTTTDHATGEVTTRTGTIPEIFPERSQDESAPARGDGVAPRGWYNPITGQVQNPGLKTGNNQVNPGPEGESSTTAATPLRLDPKDLVINPPPDVVQVQGVPAPIVARKPDQVDPPRPM